MRLVEAVAGELGHQVEDVLGLVLGDVVRPGPGHELAALLFHHLRDLLAHGPAQDVRVAQAVAGQDVGDLHHLFLVDDHPVGFLEHLPDLRQRIVGLAMPVLGVDEGVDHARVERARPVERDQGDQVGELLRLHAHQQVAHAVALQLEHAQTVPAAEQGIGLGVVHGDLAQIDTLVQVELDQFERPVDHGQGLEAEKVEFDQPGFLGVLHVELGEDLLVRADAHRQVLHHGPGRDDHAGGMGRLVPRQPFERLRDGQQPADVLVLHGLAQPGLGVDGLLQGDLQFLGHQLGDAVHLGQGDVEHPAHVAQHGPRLHRPVGHDLGHVVVAAVALADVVDHLVAPLLAEIHVKVGHGHPLDVEEPLEQEPVGQGIDVGDGQAVGGQAAGARTAARPHRDLLLLGPVDEVGNDQEVAGKPHLPDDVDLQREPVAVGDLGLLGDRPQFVQLVEPAGQPVPAGPGEERVQGLALLDREHREVVGAKLQLQVAALRHLERVGHRLGAGGEMGGHLLGRLEVEGVGGEAEAARVVDGAAGLDAEQHLVGVGFVPVEVVAVVGGHQLDAQLAGELDHAAVGHGLLGNAVFLEFQVEAVAEDLLQLHCPLACAVRVVVGEAPGDLAVQAGGEDDQPLLVGVEGVQVDARPVVEPPGLGQAAEFHQVGVPGPVHGQGDQVEVVAGGAVVAEHAVLGHVELAADDGFDPGLLRLFVEFERAVHGAVVGDGHRRHVEFLGALDEVTDADGAVEHGILGVDVQMDKGCGHETFRGMMGQGAGNGAATGEVATRSRARGTEARVDRAPDGPGGGRSAARSVCRLTGWRPAAVPGRRRAGSRSGRPLRVGRR